MLVLSDNETRISLVSAIINVANLCPSNLVINVRAIVQFVSEGIFNRSLRNTTCFEGLTLIRTELSGFVLGYWLE